MNYIPTQDIAIVRRDEIKATTESGLILPDPEEEIMGEIIALGEGLVMDDGTKRPMDISAGDRILFAKCIGQDIHIDGEDLLMMRETDILAQVF